MPQDRREGPRAQDSAARFQTELEATLSMAQLAGSINGVNACAEVFMDDALRNHTLTGQEVADMLKRYASALASVGIVADDLMNQGARITTVGSR